MAADHQIDQAFQDLGALFAGEHSEHDDEGARQVGRMIRLLRRFKAREQTERERRRLVLPGLREATYELHDGRRVLYDAGDLVHDAADLYAVLAEDHVTGSPNVENQQAARLLGQLQSGEGLGEMHVGTLRNLLTKYAARIEKYRRTKDTSGQDMLATASAGPDARIINPKES